MFFRKPDKIIEPTTDDAKVVVVTTRVKVIEVAPERNHDHEVILGDEITLCSRCYLKKPLATTLVINWPKHPDIKFHDMEVYDLCKDCDAYARCDTKEAVEHARFCGWKFEDGKKLEPYQWLNRSRWRTVFAFKHGLKWPDYNIDSELNDPPIPGVTKWEVRKDWHTLRWEDRPVVIERGLDTYYNTTSLTDVGKERDCD
jgi:hypothetical protein